MQKSLALAALVLLLYVLSFHRLGARELWSSHERVRLRRETILEGADWRLPRLFDGRLELQKPPLYYWLTALLAQVWGQVDEVSVRLPAVLGFLFTGLAVFTLLWQQGLQRAAWFGMIALWTMLHFTWMSRVGRIDMPLTATCSWGIVSMVLGSQRSGWASRGWLLAGYLCLAAGLMLKGPIAAVLCGLVLLISCLVLPELRRIISSAGWGIPLVALLVLPWVWWVQAETHGQFVQEFLIKHNLQRGLGGDEQLDGHVHPWWFYLVRIWLDAAPWVWLLPLVLLREMRTGFQPGVLFGLGWFLSILILLSLLQYKRADYLLPAYPGLALALGVSLSAWLEAASQSLRKRYLQGGMIGLAVLMLGWFLYTEMILRDLEAERRLRPFAQTVRAYLPRPGQVILFRVDSHHLVWELGRPTERIWEWENLSWWAIRPTPIFVVMPKRYAEECQAQLPEGKLVPLATTGENGQPHEVPLVLMVNEHGKPLAQHPEYFQNMASP